MIAGHGGLDQVGPSQLLETVIGNQRRDPRSESRSDRQNMNDPIAQFAPGYMTLLDDQNRTALLEYVSGARGDEFTRPLVDKQTSGQIPLQVETNSDERQFLSDVFQSRGNNRDIRSLYVPYQGPLTEGMMSRELAFDRAVDAPATVRLTQAKGASFRKCWRSPECRSTIVIAWWPCYSARDTPALVQVAGTGGRGPFHSPMAIRK
jgi:hypothetical protein